MRQREGGVLSWGKPEKKLSTEAWQAISADGAPPGVYTPNMSDDDARKWKAKLAGQRSGELRAEIRKTVSSAGTGGAPTAENGWTRDTSKRAGTHAQVLIIVYADGEVRMSANGAMAFSQAEWRQLKFAVAEARAALAQYQAGQARKAAEAL